MPCHGGHGQWPEIGKWHRVPRPLQACVHGLHVSKIDSVLWWITPIGYTSEIEIYEVAGAGDRQFRTYKIVFEEAMLIRRLLFNREIAQNFLRRISNNIVLSYGTGWFDQFVSYFNLYRSEIYMAQTSIEFINYITAETNRVERLHRT